MVSTVIAAYISYAMRMPCFGTHWPSALVSNGTGCYADLQVMWFKRGLAHHLIPYLQPFVRPDGLQTTIEYPVLSGALMWLISLPAHSYAGFVKIHAVVMAVLAVVLTLVLYRTTGRRAWVWVASPALVFYLTYNVDLPPALCAVAGFAILAGQDPRTVSTVRYLGAALLFAIGAGLKLYPLLFGVALICWLLFGRTGPDQTPLRRRGGRAGLASLSAVAFLVAVNLPVTLANFDGWAMPYRQQAVRGIDASTMSMWYFIGHMFHLPDTTRFSLATVATVLGLIAIMALSWLVARRRGEFPLLACGVALLCTYLALNKVFSPQYIIWILPLLLLVGLRTWVVLIYVILDPVLYWSWWFRVLGARVHVLPMWHFWISVNNAAILVRLVYIAAIAAIVLTQQNEEGERRVGRFPWRDALWLPTSAPKPDRTTAPSRASELDLPLGLALSRAPRIGQEPTLNLPGNGPQAPIFETRTDSGSVTRPRPEEAPGPDSEPELVPGARSGRH